MDIFNVTNTPSFDVPNNNANISQGRLSTTSVKNGNTPTAATTTASFGQVLNSASNQQGDFNSLYVQPKLGTTTFGAVRNTIGGSRTIEMSLHIVY
jgi:hypothetical protein